MRLVSATNHDLQALIQEGRFREDLYFRIRGVEIHIPPLRKRREDIAPLSRHFLQRFAQQMNKPISDFDEQAQLALMQYDWPGNVRQLLNTIQNMVVVAEGPQIKLADVPAEVRRSGQAAGESDLGSLAGLSLDQIEKQAIRNTLRLTGGNREQAAKLLGIGERTLYRKLKEFDLK